MGACREEDTEQDEDPAEGRGSDSKRVRGLGVEVHGGPGRWGGGDGRGWRGWCCGRAWA